MTKAKMPPPAQLGQHAQTTMLHAMNRWEHHSPVEDNPHGYPTVMGFNLPPWQRGLVWTKEQNVAFIESAWRGVNLGTFTYNQVFEVGHPLDGLLIDGQQRMNALQLYLSDEFPVFGWHWSELTDVDQRRFAMNVHFPCYVTDSTDEEYLKGYYNLMNFSGTPHKESERA